MRRNTKGAWFGGGEVILLAVGLGLGSGLATDSVSDVESARTAQSEDLQRDSGQSEPQGLLVSSLVPRELKEPAELTSDEKLSARLMGVPLGELRAALEERDVRFEKALRRVFRETSFSSSDQRLTPHDIFSTESQTLEGTMEFTIDERLVVLVVKIDHKSLILLKRESVIGQPEDPGSVLDARAKYTLQEIGVGKTALDGEPDVKGTLWASVQERDGKFWFGGTFDHDQVDDFGHALFFERPRAEEMGRFEVVLDENAQQIRSGLVRWKIASQEGPHD